MTPRIRDPRAHRIPAPQGSERLSEAKSVLVVGGGIAGLAAATGLAERGVDVTLAEPCEQLGGRVRSWPVDGPGGRVTMSRGFHAFFRQYYNLRKLLERIPGADGEPLRAVEDYPLRSSSGLRDSFRKIPRTPPWSFIGFVLRSPSFRLRDLPHVDLDTALSMLDVDFPQTYRRHDGQSAQQFLDRLGFPERARHLALEVFARSFFAAPSRFSAGELVAMFHTYFLGSAEGLLFDTASDDFDTALWAPLGRRLEGMGVRRRRAAVDALAPSEGGVRAVIDGRSEDYDAVVLAAGPQEIRRLGGEMLGGQMLGEGDVDGVVGEGGGEAWRRRLENLREAPPFAVWRLWLDRPVNSGRAAFLGTTGFGPLDNVSVLERFEDGAAQWAREHGGSVVELHAYALAEGVSEETLRHRLLDELARVYPETRSAAVLHDEFLLEHDCPLIGLEPWDDRPTVRTPNPRLMLAGDAVRCDEPVALMERAATTGWQAANALLEQWSVRGHDLWSPPMRARTPLPGLLRKLMRAASGIGRLRRGARSR